MEMDRSIQWSMEVQPTEASLSRAQRMIMFLDHYRMAAKLPMLRKTWYDGDVYYEYVFSDRIRRARVWGDELLTIDFVVVANAVLWGLYKTGSSWKKVELKSADEASARAVLSNNFWLGGSDFITKEAYGLMPLMLEYRHSNNPHVFRSGIWFRKNAADYKDYQWIIEDALTSTNRIINVSDLAALPVTLTDYVIDTFPYSLNGEVVDNYFWLDPIDFVWRSFRPLAIYRGVEKSYALLRFRAIGTSMEAVYVELSGDKPKYLQEDGWCDPNYTTQILQSIPVTLQAGITSHLSFSKSGDKSTFIAGHQVGLDVSWDYNYSVQIDYDNAYLIFTTLDDVVTENSKHIQRAETYALSNVGGIKTIDKTILFQTSFTLGFKFAFYMQDDSLGYFEFIDTYTYTATGDYSYHRVITDNSPDPDTVSLTVSDAQTISTIGTKTISFAGVSYEIPYSETGTYDSTLVFSGVDNGLPINATSVVGSSTYEIVDIDGLYVETLDAKTNSLCINTAVETRTNTGAYTGTPYYDRLNDQIYDATMESTYEVIKSSSDYFVAKGSQISTSEKTNTPAPFASYADPFLIYQDLNYTEDYTEQADEDPLVFDYIHPMLTGTFQRVMLSRNGDAIYYHPTNIEAHWLTLYNSETTVPQWVSSPEYEFGILNSLGMAYDLSSLGLTNVEAVGSCQIQVPK